MVIVTVVLAVSVVKMSRVIVRQRAPVPASSTPYPAPCIVGAMPTKPMPVPPPRPMPGATMRRLRRRLGWTQVQLAVALGVHANSVARWERDEVPIRPPVSRLVQHLAAAPAGRRARGAR
jgi:acetyl-CoA acetyltransferase